MTVDKPKILTRKMFFPFFLVAILFPLWGFANDVTNPLDRVFKDLFMISNAESSLVQFAFYLGYGIMALPAAIFIRRFSYKSGILLGLGLYAVGAMLFIPASTYAQFYFFLGALCVLTCGIAFLEVAANPYILSMGDPETATQRLNLAQALNPIGSLIGMFVASSYILSQLQVEAFRSKQRAANPEYEDMLPSVVDGKLTDALNEYAEADPVAYQAMQAADLITVREPYVVISIVVIVLFCICFFCKLPRTTLHDQSLTFLELKKIFGRIFTNKCYLEGVLSQGCYVGAQIMIWTFIIHYSMSTLGLTAAQAQNYNIVAMLVFLFNRFVCTFLLGFIRPGMLLMLMAISAVILLNGAIFLNGYRGLYSLIGVAACMSLMFPTIYAIALKGLGDDSSLASAGLVMAIVGGAFMPPLQGLMIDAEPIIVNIPSIKTSFFLPMLCFIVVVIYGYRSHFVHKV